MREIEKLKLIDQFTKKGRFYVKFDRKYSVTNSSVMPRSHYIWLLHCPDFERLPKGYVLHHLDWDETNDDISNLALMLTGGHAAHHFKNAHKGPRRLFYEAVVDREIVALTPRLDEKMSACVQTYKGKKKSTHYVIVKIGGKKQVFGAVNGRKIASREEAEELAQMVKDGKIDMFYKKVD